MDSYTLAASSSLAQHGAPFSALCKALLSGFSGPLISLVVIFGGGNVSAAPLLPRDAAAGAALASNVFLVAAAFMLLTIGKPHSQIHLIGNTLTLGATHKVLLLTIGKTKVISNGAQWYHAHIEGHQMTITF